MKDQLRPGQRIINYARMVKNITESMPPDGFEIWLWNLSQKEFEKVMKWSPNDD